MTTPKEIIDAFETLDSAGRRKVARAIGKIGKKANGQTLTATSADGYNPDSMSTATLQHDFGQTVRHIREEKGLSQQELAERARIRQATISDIETGRQRPTRATRSILAMALGVNLAELSPVA